MYSLPIERFSLSFLSTVARFFHPVCWAVDNASYFQCACFNDTVGFPSVSKANPVIFVWVFWLWLRPLSLFASLFFLLAKRKSGRGICVSSLLWCVFPVGLMICRNIMKPRCFMMLLICLLAYPNVRTEPQSEIGRNRGKKTEEIGATLFAKDQEQINFVACCVDEYTSF